MSIKYGEQRLLILVINLLFVVHLGYAIQAQNNIPDRQIQKVRAWFKRVLPHLADPDPLVIKKGLDYLNGFRQFLGVLPKEERDDVVEKLCGILPKIGKDKELRLKILTVIRCEIDVILKVKNTDKRLANEFCNLLQQEKQDLTDKEAVMMIVCLGHIGPEAEKAVSMLIEIAKKKVQLDDPEFYPPQAALWALGKILDKKAVPFFCEFIRDKSVDSEGYMAACFYLGLNSPAALQELSTDPEPEVRRRVFYSLPHYILDMPLFYTIRNKGLADSDEKARLAICSRLLLDLDVKETEDILNVLKTLAQEGSAPSIKNEAAELLKKAMGRQKK